MSSTPEARRGPPPAAVMKVMNPIFTGILYSPLHRLMSKGLLVLTFRGRKSGKRFSIPVAYAQQGETVLIATQRPWHRNLIGGQPVNLRLRGTRRSGRAEVISDIEGLAVAFRDLLKEAPRLGEFLELSLNANGELRREDVERVYANGWVVVEIRLAH